MKRHIKSNLKIIIAKMIELGIETAEVSYHGEGDSGDTNDIALTPNGVNEDAAVTISRANVSYTRVGEKYETTYTTDEETMSIRLAIQEIAWDAINANHEGFENDSGGGGTFIIDAEEGAATLSHYYISMDSSCMTCQEIEPDNQNESLTSAIAVVQNKLIQHGIDSVSVGFSGYGDSGSVNDFTVDPSQNDEVLLDDTVDGDVSVKEFLSDLAEEAISHFNVEGYQDDAGGYGHLLIPATGNATFECWSSYEEENYADDVTYSIADELNVEQTEA